MSARVVSQKGASSPAQSREDRLVNLLPLLFCGLTLAYVPLFLILTQGPFAFINLGAAILWGTLAVLARFGFLDSVRWLVIVLAWTQIAVLSVLGGQATLTHLFLIIGLPVVFLIFRPEQRRRMFVLAGLTVAIVCFLEFGRDPAPLLEVSGETLRSFRASVVAGIILQAAALSFYSYRAVRGAEEGLQREHEQSERLLRNILPEPIAIRLKQQVGRIAERFDDATVLFADIAGFTPLSAEMEPERVVALLDELFSRFEGLVEKHGLEKIKTIGDCFMVVGGLPQRRPDHAEAVAAMALDMIDEVSSYVSHGSALNVRIGIHTGPVVAGVIGRKKFSYDLWGDTVNTASRMESHGVVGGIHVTAAVFERLRDRFTFTSRGVLDVKGKGKMETWLLTRCLDERASLTPGASRMAPKIRSAGTPR